MKLPLPLLRQRAKQIKLLAMDVDGVLTGGEVVVLESGEEIKFWNAKDRLALAMARDHVAGLKFAWITGRRSSAVTTAAKDLGIHFVVQGCGDKKTALNHIVRKLKIDLKEVAFIGDDLIDLPVLGAVGLAACPADAVMDVKKRVHYISPYSGGKGVVRDLLEIVLKAQNIWERLLKSLYL